MKDNPDLEHIRFELQKLFSVEKVRLIDSEDLLIRNSMEAGQNMAHILGKIYFQHLAISYEHE